MTTVDRREIPFPEDLEGRMNAMLNVINTELKAATLLHLDDVPREGAEIRAKVRETIGTGIYLPVSRALEGYCHSSFFPIGAVAEETIVREEINDTSIGYSLTAAGKRYGLPVAAFSLNYAVKNKRSMFQVLGQTASPGKTRSPLNRIKIIEALRDNSLRMTDLAERTDLGEHAVLHALQTLQEVGFVQYESVGEIKNGYSPYVWVPEKNPEEANAIRTNVNLTKRVAKELSQLRKADCRELSRTLSPVSSHEISRILSGLEEQGLIRRVRWKGGIEMSQARLLDKGKEFLEVYITPIKNMLLDDCPVLEISLPEVVRAGIGLYTNVSPQINGRPRQERNDEVIDFLLRHPGSRTVEIAKACQQCSRYLLTPLIKTGVLRKVKRGRETRYWVSS